MLGARTLWAVFVMAISAAIGCHSGRDSTSQNPAENTEAAPEISDLLTVVKQQTAAQHPYIGSAEADSLRQSLNVEAAMMPANVRWFQSLRLAQCDLQLGREREAIEGLLECLQFLPQVVTGTSKLQRAQVMVMFQLGVAYMRLGETQNCCARNHPESCILPIRGGGIHVNQDGSRNAVKCFTFVLNNTEQAESEHLKARWLLNIAAMTLGEHPDSVPDKFLIPAEAFESEIEFPQFANVASPLGVDTFSMCGGALADDFDNDNDLDLIVSSWDPREPVKYFRNGSDGSFEDWSTEAGLEGSSGGLNLVHADYDNDGDLDFLVLRGGWLGSRGKHPNSLMRNDGNAKFTDVTLQVGMMDHYPTQTAAWGDYDNDGDLDLFIGNERDEDNPFPCQLYRNDNGQFKDVAEQAGVSDGGYVKAAVWGDVNEDSYPDLFLSNNAGANRLFINQKDGTFRNEAAAAGVEKPLTSFPAWFWDYDNDGHLDLYVSAYSCNVGDLAAFLLGIPNSSERSVLYRGDGMGKFEDVTVDVGLTRPDASMGANFGDLDGDGFLDFYLGTGYPKYDSLMPSVMYLNRGGQFVDVTTAGGFGNLQKGHAVAFADFDQDGDLDVFEQMGGAFPGDQFHDALYENPGLGNHWVSLKLIGEKSNRSAIGARITVDVKDGASTRRIYRHVNGGGSFGGNPLRQTIGLGAADGIESIEIFWPASGLRQQFVDVEMDQFYIVNELSDAMKKMQVSSFQLGR